MSETKFPIELNAETLETCDLWAADDRLWTTQETIAFNLRTFARKVIHLAAESQRTQAPSEQWIKAAAKQIALMQEMGTDRGLSYREHKIEETIARYFAGTQAQAAQWMDVKEFAVPVDDLILAKIAYRSSGNPITETIVCYFDGSDLYSEVGDDIGWTDEVITYWQPLPVALVAALEGKP